MAGIIKRRPEVAIAALSGEGRNHFIISGVDPMKTIMMTGAAGGVATFLRRELVEYNLRLSDVRVVADLSENET